MKSPKRIATFLALVIPFALGAGVAQAAPTETVTSLNDSGAGSLRQALASVDAGGRVVFDPSLSGTIAVQTALLIDKSVTIEGPGTGRVTLDGSLRDNIVVVGSVTPGEHDVSISGLTFTRGLAAAPAPANPATTANQGGAISVLSGDSIAVSDSVFRQNLAISNSSGLDSEGGGAVSVEKCSGAELAIDGSTFLRNSSTKGGGAVMMRSDRALTIEDSEFSTNTTDDFPGGGAVAVRPHRIDETDNCTAYGSNVAPTTSPVTIARSAFFTNGSNADSNGGAISFAEGAGPAQVTDSIFRSNGNDQIGGAIWSVSASPIRVAESAFTGNMTDDRGGAISYRPNYSGPAVADELLLSVEDSLFEGNAVELDGGAIDYRPRITSSRTGTDLRLRVIDSAFRRNFADDSGGAIYFAPFFDTTGSDVDLELSIRGSEFIGNFAGFEGIAIHRGGSDEGVARPVLDVSDSVFEENFTWGNQGGTLHYQPTNSDDAQGAVSISGSDFTGNFGGEGSSPIFMNASLTETVIEDTSVTDNASGDGVSPGLYLGNDGSPSSSYLLRNVTVAGNSSAQTGQGSVDLNSGGTLTLENSTVALNSLSGSAGTDSTAGLRLDANTTATVRNSVLAGNTFAGPLAEDSEDELSQDCFKADTATLTFEGANLVGNLTNCEAATGPDPITGNPGFAELDPVEVQRLGTENGTFIVPLAATSNAVGAALGTVPSKDQRGADRPSSGADLGAVQYYESHTLTVEKSGSGKVTSNWGAIDCGEACEDSYPDQQVVTLTAEPEAGAAFTGWSGGCTGTTYTCQVTMDQARTVTATFGAGGGGNGRVQIKRTAGKVVRVGNNRTFAVARVTCKVGNCQITRVSGLTVRVRGRQFKARAIFPKAPFAAGQSRTLKVQIPKRAHQRLLRSRKSGKLALSLAAVARDEGGAVRGNVFRSIRVNLQKR